MKYKFAIVVSKFNHSITNGLLQGVLERFEDLQINTNEIQIIEVPGAVEIPLAAKLLAKKGIFNAIICLGAVIRGETSHYDYVCSQVSSGCQHVMLEFDVPVIFGILTTENEQQAYDRIGGKEGHKGKEAADVAFEMVKIVNYIQNLAVI